MKKLALFAYYFFISNILFAQFQGVNPVILSVDGIPAYLKIGLSPGTTGYSWLQSFGSLPLRINEVGNNVLFNAGGGFVGIGTNTPSAKLHVHNDEGLLLPLGSVQLLSRISGRGNNYFMESQWLVRDDASSIGWTTARMHNGISIDDSFLNPGTDTRTWWERDPYNNIQSWGQGNQTYMTINNGNVGIGTINPDTKLAVKGTVHAEEVKVDLTVPAPDYVFEKNYNLPTLAEVETYIKQNKHLPEVPAAKEMEKNGVNLGEMNMLLLKKVEELTLYVLEQHKTNQMQSNEIKLLKQQLRALELK